MLQGAEGQLGDLGSLASGDLSKFGPTGADRELVEQSIGATSDIVGRQIEGLSAEGQSRLGEQLSSRGIQGSSIESVDRAILERDLQRQGADRVSQAGIQGSQALMNLPFQRAGVAMNANQLLFQQILGAANPILAQNLQERLAQAGTTKTETKSGGQLGSLLQLGATAAGTAIGGPVGGALGNMLGGAVSGSIGGDTVPGTNTSTSLLGGFQSGLRVGG